MGMRRFVPFWGVCQVLFIVFWGSGYVLADEVILANGDRLSGRITEIRDGVLTLETDYSEPSN